MTRLYCDWQPTFLDEIIGQPCIAKLKRFVARPRNDALLLFGPSGTGKITAAEAVAAALGATDFPMTIYRTNGTKLCLELAERYFDRDSTPFRYKSGEHWHVLIIEEVEWLHSQTVNYLKDNLEKTIKDACRKVIVIATSNDITAFKKQRAFLDRFRLFEFTADTDFAGACLDRLKLIAATEGVKPPTFLEAFDDDGHFSMRRAIDLVEDLAAEKEVVPA